MTYTKRHIVSIMADGTVIFASDATTADLRDAMTQLARYCRRHLLAECFDPQDCIANNDELWGIYYAVEDREGGR